MKIDDTKNIAFLRNGLKNLKCSVVFTTSTPIIEKAKIITTIPTSGYLVAV